MQTGNGSEILGPVNSGGQEEGVVKQREWGAIRTLRERGMSKKAIARELEVDIKTVRKWLKEEWKEQRRKRGQGLDKWREFLQRRAPEVGFNAAVLLREARGQGYEGCYQSLVKCCIRALIDMRVDSAHPDSLRYGASQGASPATRSLAALAILDSPPRFGWELVMDKLSLVPFQGQPSTLFLPSRGRKMGYTSPIAVY